MYGKIIKKNYEDELGVIFKNIIKRDCFGYFVKWGICIYILIFYLIVIIFVD